MRERFAATPRAASCEYHVVNRGDHAVVGQPRAAEEVECSKYIMKIELTLLDPFSK
jgi:hypothetical protein